MMEVVIVSQLRLAGYVGAEEGGTAEFTSPAPKGLVARVAVFNPYVTRDDQPRFRDRGGGFVTPEEGVEYLVGLVVTFREMGLIGRGLDAAADAAGLNGGGLPKLRLHDLRHTFASLLISEGADVVYVSRQLGHADPSITLKVYSHLFDRQRHADRTRAALEAKFAEVLDGPSTDEKGRVVELPRRG